MESPLGERQPVDAERHLVPAAAVPAERRELLRHVTEDNTVLVTQLDHDARRRDAAFRLDAKANEHRVAGGKLHALLARVVDQRGGGDARLTRSPFAEPGLQL